ncbi:MAG: tRNA pseudouridine(13) synthase TruD, partial [Candidatus Hodarchaeales archaeon]
MVIETAPLDFIGINQKIPWKRETGNIKQEPEDFIVREITPDGSILNDNTILQDETGLFTHVVVKKRNMDTFSITKVLSEYLGDGVTGRDINFAGLKDSRAITYQRGSIWNVRPEDLDDFLHDRIRIISAVRGLYGVETGDLKGNHFRIKVVSPSSSFERIQKAAKVLENKGFPNFFMMQRFGSKRPILHLLGKDILLGNYKSAVLCYLGTVSSFENESITKARENLLERELDGLKDFRRMMPRFYEYEHQLAKNIDKKHPNYHKALFSL